MKAMTRLFRMPVGGNDADAFLLRLAQLVCYGAGAFVFAAGLLKVSHEDLAEAQLFSAVQQVMQTALLFCITGLLLNRSR
jgi:hypothetical protein